MEILKLISSRMQNISMPQFATQWRGRHVAVGIACLFVAGSIAFFVKKMFLDEKSDARPNFLPKPTESAEVRSDSCSTPKAAKGKVSRYNPHAATPFPRSGRRHSLVQTFDTSASPTIIAEPLSARRKEAMAESIIPAGKNCLSIDYSEITHEVFLNPYAKPLISFPENICVFFEEKRVRAFSELNERYQQPLQVLFSDLESLVTQAMELLYNKESLFCEKGKIPGENIHCYIAETEDGFSLILNNLFYRENDLEYQFYILLYQTSKNPFLFGGEVSSTVWSPKGHPFGLLNEETRALIEGDGVQQNLFETGYHSLGIGVVDYSIKPEETSSTSDPVFRVEAFKEAFGENVDLAKQLQNKTHLTTQLLTLLNAIEEKAAFIRSPTIHKGPTDNQAIVRNLFLSIGKQGVFEFWLLVTLDPSSSQPKSLSRIQVQGHYAQWMAGKSNEHPLQTWRNQEDATPQAAGRPGLSFTSPLGVTVIFTSPAGSYYSGDDDSPMKHAFE